jgi:hypothetical protein
MAKVSVYSTTAGTAQPITRLLANWLWRLRDLNWRKSPRTQSRRALSSCRPPYLSVQFRIPLTPSPPSRTCMYSPRPCEFLHQNGHPLGVASRKKNVYVASRLWFNLHAAALALRRPVCRQFPTLTESFRRPHHIIRPVISNLCASAQGQSTRHPARPLLNMCGRRWWGRYRQPEGCVCLKGRLSSPMSSSRGHPPHELTSTTLLRY